MKKIRNGQIGAKQFGLGPRFYDACLVNWIADESVKNNVAQWIKKPKNFVVMLGNTGVGKTYFCAALLNYFFDQGDEVYYMTSRHFFQKLQEAIKEDRNQYFEIQKYADQDILIIDDIGAGTCTQWQQEMLLEIIDLRYNSMKPTVITSNLTFIKIEEDLGYRTRSRLQAKENLKIDIRAADRRT